MWTSLYGVLPNFKTGEKENMHPLLAHLYIKCLTQSRRDTGHPSRVEGRWGAEGRGSGQGDILLYSLVPLHLEPRERMLPTLKF